jgi:hypothetical protein
MFLQFLFFKLVGFDLDLMSLHVVLLLAELLLDTSQLQQLGAFMEFPLNIDIVLCIFLGSMRITICFSCFWDSSASIRSI